MYIYFCRGTVHTSQSDGPFIMPKLTQRWGRQASRLDPVLAHKLNMDICHSFLKRYQLRGSYNFIICIIIHMGHGSIGHTRFDMKNVTNDTSFYCKILFKRTLFTHVVCYDLPPKVVKLPTMYTVKGAYLLK